jgi:hypothetical protein
MQQLVRFALLTFLMSEGVQRGESEALQRNSKEPKRLVWGAIAELFSEQTTIFVRG